MMTPAPIASAQTDSASTTPSHRVRSPTSTQVQNDPKAASSSEALDAAITADSDAESPGSFEMSVTALNSATHFAPVARLSPVQQVVDTVAGAMPSLLGTSSPAAAADVGDEAGASASLAAATLVQTAQPSAGSIKELNLQLQPETLGQVTIKLNLSDNGLAVQLEAANQQTADLFDKDKHALTQGLSESGYSVASLDMSVAPQHGSLSDSASQQGQAESSAGQPGGQFSGFDGQPHGGRNNDAQSAFTEPLSGAQNLVANDPDASANRSSIGGDLFV